MLCDEKLIDELASQILEQHSFHFNTFPSARSVITIPGDKPVVYDFDRLSLCVYSHSLDSDAYHILRRQLTKQYKMEHCREDQKCRVEYGVLFHFMSVCPEYLSMKITKKEQPDFQLAGVRSIGIEVTKFTTEIDSVLISISRENFGLGKSATEIKQAALKKHGQKAFQYNYYTLNKTSAVGCGVFDTKKKREAYAKQVIKKYKLYKDIMADFNEFLLLCDAQLDICVTSKKDSDDIVEKVLINMPDIHGFSLFILRDSDRSDDIIVDKYDF